MASTSEHISIRIPADVMAALRMEALEVERSVSWLIVKKLSGQERARGRKLVGERKPEDAERRIDQSAGPSGHVLSEGTRVQVPPSFPTKSCPDCGALTGHQKWCKLKAR